MSLLSLVVGLWVKHFAPAPVRPLRHSPVRGSKVGYCPDCGRVVTWFGATHRTVRHRCVGAELRQVPFEEGEWLALQHSAEL